MRDTHTRETIFLRAPVVSYSGYGLHTIQIVSDLLEEGYECQISPLEFDESFHPIPSHIKKRLTNGGNEGDWILQLSPPRIPPVSGKKTAFFTMWESTGLPSKAIAFLNSVECIFVPCLWNLEQFQAEGVERPIYQIPLGINTSVFKYSEFPINGPCIFGTGGRMAGGGIRKGFDLVTEAFLDAFPNETDVRLLIKGFPDCPMPVMNDPRISIVQQYFTEEEMAGWFKSLTCFISAARGEAWGLMQHQALACGRPLISIKYGGVREFFDESMGYPVDYDLVPAQSHYRNCGLWAEPLHESLVEQMRKVYQNRDKAASLGKNGAAATSQLSWRASNQRLSQVMREVGMLN